MKQWLVPYWLVVDVVHQGKKPTYHVEGYHIAERNVTILVTPNQILVHTLRRTACRKTEHERFARGRTKSLDAILEAQYMCN